MVKDGENLVIIGGGITGLSTALCWALNVDTDKNPVLILEKENKVGGYVTSYKRAGYLFDTTQLIPNADDIFAYFGITIDLKKFDSSYARIILVDHKSDSIKRIGIPAGYDNFRSMLIKRYPDQEVKIKNFLDYTRALYLELSKLKVEPNIFQLLATRFKCPKIVKNHRKTFRSLVDSFDFTNTELLEILNNFAAFSALPADRVAALLTVGAMHTTLDGAFRPYKGFIEIPQKLRKRLLELGGKVRCKAEVESIIVNRGKVKGVRLKSGEIIDAAYVVTTIDPKNAMLKLVGREVLKKTDKAYLKKVEKVKMSTSSFNVALGLDDKIDLSSLNLDNGYNIITTGGDTFSKLFDAFDKNEIGFSHDCFHLGVVCPSLTTGKKPCLIIRVVPMPLSDWQLLYEKDPDVYKRKKEKWADFFIEKVESYLIADLSKHIIYRDIATPATYARYSGSPTGSIYDMAPYPENFGRKRLKMRTPVKRLFQPKFSHGVWPSLQAGMQVIDMILRGGIMGGNTRYQARNFL